MIDKKYELFKAFPAELEEDVSKVLSVLEANNKLRFSHCFKVNFRGSKLFIPERIYYNEPYLSSYSLLTDRQQAILNCLFTRHENGFIRENHVRKMMDQTSPYNWIVPYLIRLTGEYVIEILEVIKNNFNNLEKTEIKSFIAENNKFYNTIESRVVSYWDCYYRSKYPEKRDYVGFEIIHYFNS